ncbi:MBL fold metallo-hydrolase [Borborobacter arsenicus]|nr:MBL fold metallo-hydrolase [Pseudaminobacter arsenicus]
MADLVQPKLINEPFSDPVLFLDFRFRRRALLFDLGYLTPLSAREIVRVSHVFVSHMHMDHFVGFDRLLRSQLYQATKLHLMGPPGLGDAVEAKLRAYSWNLLGVNSADLVLAVADWGPSGFVRCSQFRARAAFAREEAEPPQVPSGVLLEDAEFRVEAAMLDHGIPSLAFALQEKVRVDVRKSCLDRLGLPVGAWLTEAKRLVRSGDALDTKIAVGSRQVLLAELLVSHALTTGPGQRIAYATDLIYSPQNVANVARLARGAKQLFIEAGYLDEDQALAASKRHLTAAQAGDIARAAGVARAVPMHFSSRYLGREAELRREFAEHF